MGICIFFANKIFQNMAQTAVSARGNAIDGKMEEGIEEGFIQKQRQRSSLLLGEQNLFNL